MSDWKLLNQVEALGRTYADTDDPKLKLAMAAALAKIWGRVADSALEDFNQAIFQSEYSIGDRVSHAKFGTGVVTEVEDHKLTIDFGAAGLKRMVDVFVERAI